MTQDTYTVPRPCMRPLFFSKKKHDTNMGQDTNIVYACVESGRGVYIKYMHTYYLCLCKTYVNICICRYTHTRNIDVHKKSTLRINQY